MKVSYLTIDDSPSSEFLEHCNYLKDRQIPAVFFCIGKNLEQEFDAAVQALKMGFKIQSHSYSHPHFSSLSLKGACYEIAKTDEIITSLYQSAGLNYTQKWFRFPYGDKGDGRFGKNFGLLYPSDLKKAKYIQDYLGKMGYVKPHFNNVNYAYLNTKRLKHDIDILWTFDIMEWALIKQNMKGLETIERVLERIKSETPKDYRRIYAKEKRWLGNQDSNEIILLHDHAETAANFKTIIDSLLSLHVKFELL